MEILSIVVPTHNRYESLERLVKEFSSCSFGSKVSFFIVDDASSKETRDRLKELALAFPMVSFSFFYDNKGAPTARNFGASLSDSEWLWFIDDDDFVSKESFCSVFSLVKKEKKNDIIFLGARKINGSAESYMNMKGRGLYAFLSRYGQSVNTSCALFRRKVFDKVGGWDVALVAGQDTDLFLRVSEFSDATIVDDVFVDIFHDSKNRITKNAKRQVLGKCQFLKKNWHRLHWLRRVRYLFSVLLLIPYLKKIRL